MRWGFEEGIDGHAPSLNPPPYTVSGDESGRTESMRLDGDRGTVEASKRFDESAGIWRGSEKEEVLGDDE